MAKKAAAILTESDPDAIFTDSHPSDATGHAFGFSPGILEDVRAILKKS